jgi:hypothetical protein
LDVEGRNAVRELGLFIFGQRVGERGRLGQAGDKFFAFSQGLKGVPQATSKKPKRGQRHAWAG